MIHNIKSPLLVTNFIDGKWLKSEGKEFPIDSPYFGSVMGTYRETLASEAKQAIKLAKKAFSSWRNSPLKERCQIMFRLRQILLERIDTIAHTISLENGKTLAESKAGVLKGIEVLEFAISLQNIETGGKAQVSRGVWCEQRREPLGVVASITPFNFPAMVPMWTIPIALTVGNCLIWKPSEKTPCTSMELAKAFDDAGLPPGVITVLQGGTNTAGYLLESPDIDAISFVGSTRAAKAVYQKASQGGKRVLALGGAKNHIILLPDADATLAGRGISDSFTGCAGQRCMAASVLLAVGNPELQIKGVISRAKEQVLGETMGAIISKKQRDFLHQAIEEAVQEGATLLLDGRQCSPPRKYPDGYWLGPTVLDHVSPDSRAAREELFGPILSIIRCDSLSTALEIENTNPYGNACSVFTNNGGLAEKVVQQSSSGMVGVNIGVPVPREPFSFGGIADSRFGHGDITGMQAIDFWTYLKKVTVKWEEQQDQNWMS